MDWVVLGDWRVVVLSRDAPEAEKFGKWPVGPAVPVPLFASILLGTSILLWGI